MKRILLFLSILYIGLAQLANAQSLTVSLPDTSVTVGAKGIDIPMLVQNFNNIGAISLKITYNPAVLKFNNLTNTPVSGFSANADTVGGVISIAWFSADGKTPLNFGNGALFNLNFDFKSGNSTLNFATAQCEIDNINNAVQTVSYKNGSISSPTKISLDNVSATPGDTVFVPLRGFNLSNIGSISLKINYDPSVLQYIKLQNDSVGFTANASNGTLTLAWFSTNNTPYNLLNGQMAKLVFKYVDNTSNLTFITASNQSQLTDLSGNTITTTFVNGSVSKSLVLSLPNVRSIPNTQVDFPVTTTNMKIGSASLKINYDPSVLTFVNVIDSTGAGSVSGSASNGVLTIGYFNTNPTISTGKIFHILFTYNSGSASLNFDQSQSQITDATGSIYSGFVYSNGSIVQDKLPKFTLVPAKIIAEDSLLTFNVTASDSDDTVLTYSATGLPSGATFTNQVFSWKPNFGQSGTYLVKFEVLDPLGGFDTMSVAITVTHNNQPPVFTQVLPDTTIKEMQTLTFTYKATDINGDSLSFSVVKGATGLTVGAKTGILSWTPTYTQSGNYVIVVSVTDGVFVVKDTAKVTVLNVNRKPYFTSYLHDITNLGGLDTVIFKYAAADSDGQLLKYFLINPPANTVINPNTGLMRFIAPKDTSSFVITVGVTDGIDTTTTTAHLKVITGIEVVPGLPTEYSLSQNYPNPFNPSTNIEFTLPKISKVVLKIYNVLGQEVATLVNQELSAGKYNYEFNASNLSSGMYIYRLQTGNNVFIKKMTLLK